MAIDPKAVEAFLKRRPREVPPFKGVPQEQLLYAIYTATGTHYEEKTVSRPHQLEGLAFALCMRRALLFYWMRLGKTKIALDWAAHLKRAGLVKKKGLVIAHGPSGAEQVWEQQIPWHTDLEARIVLSGKGAPDAFVDALDSTCDLIVTPWSTLQTLFTVMRTSRKGAPKLYVDTESAALAAQHFSHVIIDETHLCSNPDGLRAQIAERLLVETRYRLGLTGTPVGRNPYALWGQAFLIDGGRTLSNSYRFFMAAFGNRTASRYSARPVYTFDPDKLPILMEKMRGISLSYGKGEVKGARVVANTIHVRMHKKQRQLYNTVLDQARASWSSDEKVTNTFHRLRQITSGFISFNDDDGHKRGTPIPSAKLDWLAETLAELPEGCPFVLFHEYTYSGELLCRLLRRLKISHAWCYGQTRNPGKEIEKFRSGKVQALVGHSRSIGTGVDLQRADYVCFFESPTSPAIRAQAQERPMARAANNPLYLDDIISSPVEEQIARYIQEGEDMQRVIMLDARKGKRVTEGLRATEEDKDDR